jgi:GAF domain-containing protein
MPEVRAAADELALLFQEPSDLPAQLTAVSDVATGLVPSTVGVSLSVFLDGETFTVTATAPDVAVVDAGQYLDGEGPCLEAIRVGQEVQVQDVLDEEHWQLYRHTGATVGIRSSLSLPLRDDHDRITGALNMYAAEPNAFHGLEAMFAAIFGVQVSEAVKNADLTFQSREWARQLPDRLAARRKLETAVGVLMARRGWSPEEARAKLRTAAEKAGIQVERVAEVVMSLSAS